MRISLGEAPQPNRQRRGVLAKTKRPRDADRSAVRFERAILRRQTLRDGAPANVGDRAAAKSASAKTGVSDDANMSNRATPHLITGRRDQSFTNENTGNWPFDGTAAVLPLGSVARRLQPLERSRVPRPKRAHRMRWRSERMLSMARSTRSRSIWASGRG